LSISRLVSENRYAPWVLALLPFLVLAVRYWNAGAGPFVDDPGIYLLHAQALADGRAYADTGYISSQFVFAPALQPPGLPVLLAVVLLAFGGYNAVAVKMTMILMALPILVVPGYYFSRKYGVVLGASVTALLGIQYAWRAHFTLSDLGFAGIFWLLIALLDIVEDREFGWWRVGALLVLGTWAMSFRFVGAALIPAIGLYALINLGLRGRKALVPPLIWSVGGVSAATLLGVWGEVFRPIGLFHGEYYGYFVRRFWEDFVEGGVAAFVTIFPTDPLDDIYRGTFLILSCVGILVWIGKNWRTGAFILSVSYLGALLSTWARSERYLFPLHPFLLFGLFWSIRMIFLRVRPDWSRVRADRGVLAVVVLMSGLAMVEAFRSPRLLDPAVQPDAQEVFAHLREEAQEVDVRVTASFARTLIWETGFPAMELIPQRPAQALPELTSKGITHVVWDPSHPASRAARRTIEESGCRFELQLVNDTYRVYRFHTPCPTDPSVAGL